MDKLHFKKAEYKYKEIKEVERSLALLKDMPLNEIVPPILSINRSCREHIKELMIADLINQLTELEAEFTKL